MTVKRRVCKSAHILAATSLFVLTLASGCSDGIERGMNKMTTPAAPSVAASDFAAAWPGRPAVFKLNDRLVLAIPPQFQSFWLQRHPTTGADLVQRLPVDVATMPFTATVGFVMHLPSFEGYTPQDFRRDFDPARVEVVGITPASMAALEPGAVGSYPPNALERFLKYSATGPDDFEERYGLRCYRERSGPATRFCYGPRDSTSGEYIALHIDVPESSPHAVFPLMRTSYFSPRYGGIEVAWRTHIDNFPRWQEIDRQIWKYIEEWNIATQPSSAAIRSSAPSR